MENLENLEYLLIGIIFSLKPSLKPTYKGLQDFQIIIETNIKEVKIY